MRASATDPLATLDFGAGDLAGSDQRVDAALGQVFARTVHAHPESGGLYPLLAAIALVILDAGALHLLAVVIGLGISRAREEGKNQRGDEQLAGVRSVSGSIWDWQAFTEAKVVPMPLGHAQPAVGFGAIDPATETFLPRRCKQHE